MDVDYAMVQLTRDNPETYAISDIDGMRALDAPYAVFMCAPRLMAEDKE